MFISKCGSKIKKNVTNKDTNIVLFFIGRKRCHFCFLARFWSKSLVLFGTEKNKTKT